MREVDYKRVTDKNRDTDLKSEFCRFCKYFNSNPCCGQQCNKEFDYCDNYKRFVEIYDRLADLEDKIKNGTLVEFNKPFYSNQFNAWCIYLKDGDYIKSLCLTKEQVEEYQKNRRRNKNETVWQLSNRQ